MNNNYWMEQNETNLTLVAPIVYHVGTQKVSEE